MNTKPNRPPDISSLIQVPTEETLAKLHAISNAHADADVRLMAAILARLCPSVEAIGNALPRLAKSEFVSFEPDAQDERAK